MAIIHVSFCFPGTAIGTYGSGVQSYSDFISKFEDKANIVLFNQVNKYTLSKIAFVLLFSLLHKDDRHEVLLFPPSG